MITITCAHCGATTDFDFLHDWMHYDLDGAPWVKIAKLTTAAREVEELRAELVALKEAARPVVKVYIDAKNNQIWSGATVTGETMALPGVTVAQLDNLARLCGENKKYSRDTCPKSDTWFANGGACGKAWDCKECADAPKRLCGEE